MNRFYLLIIIAILSIDCSSTNTLTDAEKAKLDPPLIRLLKGEESAIDNTGVFYRTDGTREYAVIIRTEKPEDLKNLGIRISSVFGDVVVAHVTTEELRKIISLTSVKAAEAGSKNFIQPKKN